ncbi:hypothetical protein Rhe02_54140 [Rhizocola hellebori]|uniref:Uncharacterized protein n=1 Tax=Rhizocola hellebori TaxID=1392758 RepID=A0A8J3VIF7_9ACTN|nr:hypothetical protein [Rhizocola hellebori]GIH07347.1 hypothetical protein Rhe02_54140 [Rhizocola hellebori]
MNLTGSNERPAKTGPLNITATLLGFAELRDAYSLPHPDGLRMTKSNGIATVEVATFGEVQAWADALGVSSASRHSSTFQDGSATHSAWAEWLGWHVRIAAHVDAPVLVAVGKASVPMPQLELVPEHPAAVAAPERTIFSHCNWIGGCDTPLTPADGSMLCPVHAAAPLEDAMVHYARELRGGAR